MTYYWPKFFKFTKDKTIDDFRSRYYLSTVSNFEQAKILLQKWVDGGAKTYMFYDDAPSEALNRLEESQVDAP